MEKQLDLQLTPAAAQHIKSQLKQRGRGLGVRIGIKTSGCSGLAYVIEFTDEQSADDLVIEQQQVKLFISPQSWKFLCGSQLDFVHEGLNSGLKFNNPNVKHSCGCGESFHV